MFVSINNKVIKLYRFLVASLLAITLVSCASTTTVRAIDSSGSVDRDVKIYLDGSYQGKGEVVHSDTKIVGSTTNVNLRKKGCQSTHHNFFRSEQLHVGALIGGIFLLFPFLWVMKYNPVHSYEFECEAK